MRESTHAPIAISVECAPNRATAYVAMSGELDLAAKPALDRARRHIHHIAPHTVIIDLADVGFADCTLINFVAQLVRTLTPGASVILCRPSASVRRLLALTHTHHVASLEDDLPCEWPTLRQISRPEPAVSAISTHLADESTSDPANGTKPGRGVVSQSQTSPARPPPHR